MPIPPSELVFNTDGSIYHLALHADQVSDLVFLVGDPGRVDQISSRFDRIEYRVSKREFVTHTGYVGDRRLSVISTGIGTDNIDIVLNELDFLFNIDPATRLTRAKKRTLQLIRLGTSGAWQPDIHPGSVVLTEYAIGLDSLMHFYDARQEMDRELLQAFMQFADQNFRLPVQPYAFRASASLCFAFKDMTDHSGITVTLPGFYGPQGRSIRGPLYDTNMWACLPRFQWDSHRVTNFEMESSGIYGLARLLGHQAVSLNLILANRVSGDFSSSPAEAMSSMIDRVLSNLSSLPLNLSR